MSAEEKTTHLFEAEVEQVLRLVIHSLYKRREVFLRELLSNASDALDKRRFAGVTDPALAPQDETLRVQLLPDAEAKTLTIWDNGIGMSRQELVENLGTVAKSGSREFLRKLEEAQKGDVNLIGQFGVGFYSAWLVADRVEVVSRKAGSREAFRWVSEGQQRFTVEPASRVEAGTSVTLHLGAEHLEYLRPHRLKELVGRYSDYLSWPIEMSKEGGEEDKEAAGFESVNRGAPLWQRPKGEVEDSQYKDLYRHLSADWNEPLGWRPFRFEGTQQFSGVVFVPTVPPFDLYNPDAHHGIRLYVKRVLILEEAEELTPRWLRFARGVVDSEDLPLNVSRETLQDSRVVAMIRKQVTKQVLELLKGIADERPEDYAKFWAGFGPVLKEGLLDAGQRDALLPLMRFRSSEQEGLTTLAEVKGRMKESQKAIYYMLGESLTQVAGSPHIEALRASGLEVLYLVDPVDQFAAEHLKEFDGVPLRSAAEAGLELEGGDAEGDQKEATEALAGLIARFRTRLQDHVSEVRLSRRLKDSPLCLVVPEGGLSPHLERIFRASQRDMPAQKRVLELNPEHAVIKNLHALLEADEDELVDGWVELLFDQARIAEGTPLADPGAFAKRVTKLVEDASGQALGRS